MKNFPENKINVSIIIASEGDGEELKATLDSIPGEEVQGLEALVLLKDGSSITEEKQAEMRTEAEKKGIRLRFQAGSSDTAEAFNTGISLSKGAWIMTLEAGDRLSKGALRQLYQSCTGQELELVIGGYFEFNAAGTRKGYRPDESLYTEKLPFLNTVFIECFDKHLIFINGNKLISRGLLLKFKEPYRRELSGDREADMFMRCLMETGSIGLLRSTVLLRKTRAGIEADPESGIRLIEDYNKLFSDQGIDDDVINGMNNRMLRLIIGRIRKVYAGKELSDEEKLCMLTGIARKKELQGLISDTSPDGADNRMMSFMLKRRMITALHRIFRLTPKDDSVRVRKYFSLRDTAIPEGLVSRKDASRAAEAAKPEAFEAPREDHPEANENAEASEDAKIEAAEAGSSEAEPSHEETEQKAAPSGLSDEELDQIRKHLESELERL